MDINQIMDMLDWNNSPEIQEKGRILASEVRCLSIFMQPMDSGYTKNVWENCALIISDKNDALLKPYVDRLLDWLLDLNWPGSEVILERLQNYRDYEWLAACIKVKVRLAVFENNKSWLLFMSYLLKNKSLWEYLEEDVLSILKIYYEKYHGDE